MAIWREYIENAYISCSHYLVNAKLHWSERIFWLVTIVVCMGCAYYVVSGSLIKYNQQRVAFKVDTSYLEWETPFPSVVICEKKPPTSTTTRQFLSKYIEKLDIDEQYVNDMKLHIFESAFIIPPNIGNTFPTVCAEDPLLCLKINYSEVTDKIRGSCTTLLDTCIYNGVNFTCCDEFLPVYTVYGKCFGFNNYGTRYPNGSRLTDFKWTIVRRPGLGEGSLTIISQHKYLMVSILGTNSVPNLKNVKDAFSHSLSTLLSEKTAYTYYARIEETSSMVKDKYVEVEYKGCRLPNENNLKYFDLYSEANCEIECYITAQKKYCNCAGHFCPVGPQEQCNIEGLKCLNNEEIVEKLREFKCHCLPDCNRIHVTKLGVVTKMGDPFFVSKKHSKKFKLNIIIPAPSLKYVRYTPTTELDLIVSIGGAVSFFLGVSFLTIAQIVYYFLVRSTTNWYRLKREQKMLQKERKMDEYFTTARRKLKLAKIEWDIKKNITRKFEEFDGIDDLSKKRK